MHVLRSSRHKTAHFSGSAELGQLKVRWQVSMYFVSHFRSVRVLPIIERGCPDAKNKGEYRFADYRRGRSATTVYLA